MCELPLSKRKGTDFDLDHEPGIETHQTSQKACPTSRIPLSSPVMRSSPPRFPSRYSRLPQLPAYPRSNRCPNMKKCCPVMFLHVVEVFHSSHARFYHQIPDFSCSHSSLPQFWDKANQDQETAKLGIMSCRTSVHLACGTRQSTQPVFRTGWGAPKTMRKKLFLNTSYFGACSTYTWPFLHRHVVLKTRQQSKRVMIGNQMFIC